MSVGRRNWYEAQVAARVLDKLLKLLSNRTTQAILSLLRTEPMYARKIASVLDLAEPEVSRRLKQLADLGVVSSEWAYIGKNVKLYKLESPEVSIRFDAEGMHVQLGAAGAGGKTVASDPLPIHVPEAGDFVGRKEWLERLAEAKRAVLVEGIPGIGKTSLLAAFCHQKGSDVFWHSFRGVESLHWLANRMAVYLSHHADAALLDAVQRDAEVAEERALMLAHADGPGRIYVFDDVHKVDDPAIQSFLGDLAGVVKQGRLLFASRETVPFLLGKADQIELGGLHNGEVEALLGKLSLDEGLRAALREKLGGHPLGLKLSVAAAEQRGEALEQLVRRLPARDLQEYLMREVYEALGEAEQRALTHASIFRVPFQLEDLRALSGKIHRTHLLRLRNRFLVQDVGDGHTMHEVIRTFFYGLIDDPRVLHERLGKHLESKHTVEGRIEALHHYQTADRRDKVLSLLEQNLDLHEFDLIDAGYHRLYMQTLQLFDGLELDERQRALVDDERGDIWFHRGDFEKALEHYNRAAPYFEARGARTEHDEDLAWKRALALARLGDKKEALQMCQVALKDAPTEGRARERLEALIDELAE